MLRFLKFLVALMKIIILITLTIVAFAASTAKIIATRTKETIS